MIARRRPGGPPHTPAARELLPTLRAALVRSRGLALATVGVADSSAVAIVAVAIVAVAILAAPGGLAAQVLVGRVLDEVSDAPVMGASVVLLDEQGEPAVRAESDGTGRYAVRPPEPGPYKLVATRLGYEAGETPLLDLTFEGSRAVDLLLRPLPIGLPGLEVTVSAEEALDRTLRMFGVTAAQLPGSRIVTTEEIERVAGARDFAHVLQRQNIAGVQVFREEDLQLGALPRTCVKVDSGWSSGCAILVVDGVVTPTGRQVRMHRAALIPPESIEAMVVLEPDEAALAFGGAGGNGAVLIFTKGSGWRR